MKEYKVIPQVEFDKSVQRVMESGMARTPAENIVLSFWKVCQDTSTDFKKFLDSSIVNGKLDVDQTVLDFINKSLPATIRYRKDSLTKAPSILLREL